MAKKPKQKFIKRSVVILIILVTVFISGRFTAPVKKETVMKIEKIPVQTKSENYHFDIPLSHSLQDYIYEVCADEEVPISLVLAMIETESNFNPEIISSTNDYGLMQINKINHERLKEEYRAADMLNPYQNTFCGIKIIASYVKKYEGNFNKALMSYNMGEYGAKRAWSNGITSTKYSKKILDLMEKYEEETKGE